ncbi:interleukin-17 receptor A-like [Conger conger]|uniref:interleukin-17 receptor A-like n=1 Tax=Conger conger TaxID=82655 RepID=UPI002A59AF8D|nr:interleukin-17 receptor A-like [Conger conger]
MIAEEKRITMNLLHVIGHVFSLMAVVSSLRLMEWPPLNCTQEGLSCSANISGCSSPEWERPRYRTPTAPRDPQVQVSMRRDQGGDLVPVLSAKWSARMDGSIFALQGTKVLILKESSNQSICIYYVFHHKIKQMHNPQSEAWSFSVDGVVVEPGQTYLVSISNLPVPDKGHNKIDKTFTVPECSDPKIQETRVCQERGSLWEPNITWNVSPARAEISVRFNSGHFSEKYIVAIHCPDFKDSHTISQKNETSLNVTFAMGRWPKTCCSFDVVIQPCVIGCSGSCAHRVRFKTCIYDLGHSSGRALIVLFLGLLFGCGCFALCIKTLRGVRKPYPPDSGMDPPATPIPASPQESVQVSSPRKVLLIYSLDHPLYRDVVLKLCAFLRARCGTEVVLDLLDSAWLSAVGRMQWLDWQKQQIEKSSQKILVLCSRGVRAKWGAMCGGGRVQLREDLRSPMGDMLTPALSLIIPDFVHSSSFQKYMVAYFEDLSSEDDVPAPFNISIKYKLMKHFEELYFRILDQEKHQPGRVKRIEGIAQDEYFNCPSGRALRDAIEALQAHQLENPDWFEKECVGSEEEVAQSELEHPLLADVCRNPVLQCVPEITEGPPILLNEVEFSEEPRGVQALVPLVRPGGSVSTQQVHAGAGLRGSPLCCSRPAVGGGPEVLQWSPRPWLSEGEPRANEALLQEPPAPMRNTCHFLGGAAAQSDPVESQEGALSPLSPALLRELEGLQASSLVGDVAPVPRVDQRNRPQSASDQGYISRSSHPLASHPLAPTGGAKPQDPLAALVRLQEACLLSSLETPGP